MPTKTDEITTNLMNGYVANKMAQELERLGQLSNETSLKIRTLELQSDGLTNKKPIKSKTVGHVGPKEHGVNMLILPN